MRMGHDVWWCSRVGSGYSLGKGTADTPPAQGSHEAPGRNDGRRGGARDSYNTHLRLGTLGRRTGRNLLREKGCGLAAISGAAFLQGGFEIKQALPDGYCVLHSVSLAQHNSYADSCILANYQAKIVDECVHAVFGERWDGGKAGGIQLCQNEGVLRLFVLQTNDNEFVHLLYSNGVVPWRA